MRDRKRLKIIARRCESLFQRRQRKWHARPATRSFFAAWSEAALAALNHKINWEGFKLDPVDDLPEGKSIVWRMKP